MIHKYWNPAFTTFSAHCWAVHHLMLPALRGNWCLKVCWLKEPLYCKRFGVFIWQALASMGPFSFLCMAGGHNDYENYLILVSMKLRNLEILYYYRGEKKLWARRQRGPRWVMLSRFIWARLPQHRILQSTAFCWDHGHVVLQVALCYWVPLLFLWLHMVSLPPLCKRMSPWGSQLFFLFF